MVPSLETQHCPRGYWEWEGGLEGITEACPGGVELNRSLSRGILQVCPEGVEVGGTFAIIVVCTVK